MAMSTSTQTLAELKFSTCSSMTICHQVSGYKSFHRKLSESETTFTVTPQLLVSYATSSQVQLATAKLPYLSNLRLVCVVGPRLGSIPKDAVTLQGKLSTLHPSCHVCPHHKTFSQCKNRQNACNNYRVKLMSHYLSTHHWKLLRKIWISSCSALEKSHLSRERWFLV